MEEIRNKEFVVEKKIQYYSDEFKQKIVQEVLTGKYTKAEAQRKYGVGGKSAILTWMRKYNLVPNYISPNKTNIAESQMPTKEEDTLKEENRELRKALEIERNKSMLFEKMLEIVEEQYGPTIKKKPVAKQFNNLNQKKGKK